MLHGAEPKVLPVLHYPISGGGMHSPFPLFLGDLETRLLFDEDALLSLIESCAEEVLPVVSLSRIMLS